MAEKETVVETPILQHKKKPKTPKVNLTSEPPVEPKPEDTIMLDGQLIKFEMGATINTGQYENIQPKIELAVSTIEKGTEIAMNYITELTKKYSINGGIKTKDLSVIAKLKSFNETDVEVDFEAVAHTYTYKSNKLISATNYIKRFYKVFDAKTIAKVCAKSWGVEQQAIEDMWDSNGEIASTLGTLVDNALEHYNKYFEMGEKIKAINGKENPAMPKHPLVRSIIEGFHALPHAEGSVLHQVLLTDVERGFCGQADRLILTGDKEVIIQDFKVQINVLDEDKNSKALAPFDILPANKLTKYSLQLNFYRQMLEKSGWTVKGMEAVVYEDNKWVVHTLEKIEVIK